MDSLLKKVWQSHAAVYPLCDKTNDRLARVLFVQVKFDLSLTPYGVLAMSCNEGMVEFIPSEPLSKVLAQYGRNIQNFLRQHHADDTGPFGIEREALDIFIKSLGTPSHSPTRRPTMIIVSLHGSRIQRCPQRATA
jgi:hypothetical protein